MRGNFHVRCEPGEKSEMISEAYLSALDKVAELRELERRRRKDPFDKEAAKPCSLEKMEALVKSLGLPYERCEWDPVLNGIEDFYLDSFMGQKVS